MADKFFNKPQLGQTQLDQAQQTNETGIDNRANSQAKQAQKSLELLSGITQGIEKVGYTIAGKYQANIDKARSLESKKQLQFYQEEVHKELTSLRDLDSMSDADMQSKMTEIKSDFLKEHKDRPYTSQLRDDLDKVQPNVLNQFISGRTNMHVKKVSNNVSEEASSLGQQLSSGTLDGKGFMEQFNALLDDGTIAHQSPESSRLIDSTEVRTKYQTLTRRQTIDAAMKGVLVQTGKPENSAIADIIGSKEFRKSMGIKASDTEYNKLVDYAVKKGAQADKFQYDSGLDGLKESLYKQTNNGMSVDIDKAVDMFRGGGKKLTEQDEHKLRKQFKGENEQVVNVDNYLKNLSLEKGAHDITNGKTKKEQEAIFNGAFRQVLNFGDTPMSMDGLTGQLSSAAEKHGFGVFMRSGGTIPKSTLDTFAPVGTDIQKWAKTNTAMQAMSAALVGTGKEITTVLGAKRVGKIRAMANVLNNKGLSSQEQTQQMTIINSSFSNINSRGKMRPIEGSEIDMDTLREAAGDGYRTTDILNGNRQNLEEMTHLAAINELAGDSGSVAAERAVQQFNDGHAKYENPDGTEIAIPVAHRTLNPTGLLMYAKGETEIAKRINNDNFTFLGDFRVDRQIGMRKSAEFNASGNYLLTYNGVVLPGSAFNYKQYTDYIATLPSADRRKVDETINKSKLENKEDSLESRKKKTKALGSGTTRKLDYGNFSFEVIE
tara:strand:+ start:5128 stop:7278 length:2151 start_codon:yes stop_codon:yes gene_type:complete